MDPKNKYTRDDLKHLYVIARKQRLDYFIERNIANMILYQAEEGRTQHYFWQEIMTRFNKKTSESETIVLEPSFPYEEIIAALKEKFPGTTVELREKSGSKGIWIEWT